MGSLPSVALVAVFGAGAAATWIAGISLSRTTDALDHRLDLGEALGGMVLLAIAGSLPELAITISAAVSGNLDIAAGNLIGGIAVQTMVLVVCDLAVSGSRPLTYLVGSLEPVLEAGLVVLVLAAVLMGALLPASVAVGGVSPASIGIVVTWGLCLAILNSVRKAPRWEISMPGSRPGRRHRRLPHPLAGVPYTGASTARVALLFAAACGVILASGVVLEVSGNILADRAGVNGVIFGATILALATALPEISSGIGAVRLGDHKLAAGDILGGNAFQLCLFLVADLVAGKPALPEAGRLNSWLAILGIALTTIYALGVVVRPRRRYARLGPDSILAIVVFALGMAGLAAISR